MKGKYYAIKRTFPLTKKQIKKIENEENINLEIKPHDNIYQFYKVY